MADQQESNIKQENNIARRGMNLDFSVNQIPKGSLTYALNGVVENFDSNSINYQNEPSNEWCLQFPEGYKNIANHFILEKNKHIFFLVNPLTGDSEIGYMDNNDCQYRIYINSLCLGFNIDFPIHRIVHKITNCSTEIYWTDNVARRFLNLDKIPYTTEVGSTVCEVRTILEIDCNKLKIQPDFSIPQLKVVDVVSGGSLTAGTVQFAIQYSDVAGDAYTSYYSITNPLPIANPNTQTLNFDYNVGKSVVLDITELDITGYFEYFNVAVIKTVNNISSVELIGTYTIDSVNKQITYSGQNQTQIKLTIADIFEKFPYYDKADGVTAVQDVLVWYNLASLDRVNYQQIFNNISLQWQSYRIPATENYSDELNATNLRSYLRDEVYAIEGCFILKNGKQTDSFHIPGRSVEPQDLIAVPPSNPDFIGEVDSTGTSPYWKIYNTAKVINTSSQYTSQSDYKGPYQSGDFSYWESTETYPCDKEIWGNLAGQPIRHHKFPDIRVSPIFESSLYTMGSTLVPVMENVAIFPIGILINLNQVNTLISQSNLTQQQKDDIVGLKITRGDRATNKSIVAKGILRNVGKYKREETEYYFPNYPYNDINTDPFLLEQPNAFNSISKNYKLVSSVSGSYNYTDIYTNKIKTDTILAGETDIICSLTTPTVTSGTIVITDITSESYNLIAISNSCLFGFQDIDNIPRTVLVYIDNPLVVQVFTGSIPIVITVSIFDFRGVANEISFRKNTLCYPNNLSAFTTEESKYRYVFNSPETSFGQPFLGNVLKLENIVFGGGKGHFTEIKKNALYKLISKEAQQDALFSSAQIANIGGFNATNLFTAYQAYLQIYINGITRKNYGYSYNSIAQYNYSADIDNNLGIKQRELDLFQYLIPAVQSVSDLHNINNFNRESSVFLKTKSTLPPFEYAQKSESLLKTGGGEYIIDDKSRYTNSQKDCSNPSQEFDISVVSYYASIKNNVVNQWGQIYSYDTIDTGFQSKLDTETLIKNSEGIIFGGDTFINKFSFKTKLPFFIDNRVNAPDDSDINYDEIGNVAYPEYWHSGRSVLDDYYLNDTKNDANTLKNIISVKANYLDCPNDQLPKPNVTVVPNIVNPNRTFYDGKIYMFAYGIPTFYVESSINIDLRQSFNNREGDFFPHVSTGIPDDWVQESFVPIVQDNTYYYNVSYSKQNKENFFSHLPFNWKEELCYTYFPFRTIYSDRQQSFSDNKINSWLIYRPISYFDFPQNYGKLTSLDGIQNRAVLSRFENKSLLYNTLLTINTNNPQAAYLGNDSLFTSSPPIDFAETDLGLVGSQNKMLLKIPQGQITIDAKRGQVFLISSNSAKELSESGSGLNRFFTDHLAFEILRHFPTVNVDNHFNGVGLHGVHDSKFDRIIISKLDYIPLNKDIQYDSITKKFYINRVYPQNTGNDLIIKEVVNLTDTNYFCNKSWTLSYNMLTQSWISFHSYIPNWYIAENNFFYSGINESCDLEAIAVQEIPTTTTTSTSTSTTTSTSTSTTSTTTTLPVEPSIYLVDRYFCETCTFIDSVYISEVLPLTIGSFYSLSSGHVGQIMSISTGTPTDSIASFVPHATCILAGCI